MGEEENMMNNGDYKGKGISSVRTSASQNQSGEDDDDDRFNSRLLRPAKSSPRNASSKYDFVKVLSATPIPSHQSLFQ